MITFIIPTIKRPTLGRAINSLLQQNNKNWKAIVVFDGVEPIDFKDARIKSIKIQKTGKMNHGGQVRNVGITAADTEWVAFLDDDDTVSKDYVDRFQEELTLNPDAKCIIFRMYNTHSIPKILPPPEDKNFFEARVGISFALKKDLNLLFKPSNIEDFRLLEAIRKGRHKMVISPYVTYFVRNSPINVNIANRILIK
jgi:glycosyltransferase involved in cell wall biosynthesis